MSQAVAASQRRGFDLSGLALGALALLLCGLVLLPLGWLAFYAFTDKAGAFTLGNFVEIFSQRSFVMPFVTTTGIAAAVAAASLLVSAPLAWLVARTDMPWRRTIRVLVTASFVTPPFLGAIAWEILAAPNACLLYTSRCV